MRGRREEKILRDVLVEGDAWFSSGDVVRSDREGRWFFVDRVGDTFRWKSENVSTAEVAECVCAVERVESVNVHGVLVPGHDGRAGCATVVFDGVAGRGQEALLEKRLEGLAEKAKKELPRYAVPVFVRVAI
ncbi:hypothetical protein LTS18_006555 [Coniosporium uncinatum]|uniref:Uncharacterized protein n=1 Tax=Coniosporium uncinatum TaxID=93489 RepID=A0ACC3DAW3_9PEZI|nr:hypothetical protein LTS18_006555 [Coniosporium uncinatum]